MMADRNLQRQIHVGCKQLGIDSDLRHDLQRQVTGKTSMADMSDADLKKLLDALKERGFNPFGTGPSRGHEGPLKGRAKPLAPRADLRFIHVMWKRLGDAGALKKPGRAGLNAFVRTQFEGKWQSVPIDIDALREPGQIDDVVQALKAMCRRAGIVLK
jgi:phage gp16-like protein